jgi:peptidoglycan/xylan/chitin deacetylase (PgdA/CDA1 family)
MSVAAGSWVGLHPHADPARASVASPSASAREQSGPEPALPPQTDPASVPGQVPWPRLNSEASITKAWRLAEGPHRKPGDKRRLVTLTFDDGPFPETTPKVLDLLAKYDVHATFFVIGRYLDGEGDRARASREVLKKVAAAGHLIGNHTHDHALLTAVSHTQVLDQIDRGASSIERVIGKKPILFRPPFGELDDFGQEAVRARQLDVLLWSIEVQDMEREDTQVMFSELVRQLTYNEGGIVLLHDIRWTSVNILKKLLVYLKARRYDPARPEREGYEIVDLPSYLREVEASPPQPGARDPRALQKKTPKPRALRAVPIVTANET